MAWDISLAGLTELLYDAHASLTIHGCDQPGLAYVGTLTPKKRYPT